MGTCKLTNTVLLDRQAKMTYVCVCVGGGLHMHEGPNDLQAPRENVT
jgi:hypothetical protein